MTANKRPSSPTPGDVKVARAMAGLTQKAAGAVVYHSMRAWQDWESGARHMPPWVFELFCIKQELRNVD